MASEELPTQNFQEIIRFHANRANYNVSDKTHRIRQEDIRRSPRPPEDECFMYLEKHWVAVEIRRESLPNGEWSTWSKADEIRKNFNIANRCIIRTKGIAVYVMVPMNFREYLREQLAPHVLRYPNLNQLKKSNLLIDFDPADWTWPDMVEEYARNEKLLNSPTSDELKSPAIRFYLNGFIKSAARTYFATHESQEEVKTSTIAKALKGDLEHKPEDLDRCYVANLMKQNLVNGTEIFLDAYVPIAPVFKESIDERTKKASCDLIEGSMIVSLFFEMDRTERRRFINGSSFSEFLPPLTARKMAQKLNDVFTMPKELVKFVDVLQFLMHRMRDVTRCEGKIDCETMRGNPEIKLTVTHTKKMTGDAKDHETAARIFKEELEGRDVSEAKKMLLRNALEGRGRSDDNHVLARTLRKMSKENVHQMKGMKSVFPPGIPMGLQKAIEVLGNTCLEGNDETTYSIKMKPKKFVETTGREMTEEEVNKQIPEWIQKVVIAEAERKIKKQKQLEASMPSTSAEWQECINFNGIKVRRTPKNATKDGNDSRSEDGSSSRSKSTVSSYNVSSDDISPPESGSEEFSKGHDSGSDAALSDSETREDGMYLIPGVLDNKLVYALVADEETICIDDGEEAGCF